MKQIYVCEKCGRQYDNYDDAYACEYSHINIAYSQESIYVNPSWKPGDIMPREITLQSTDVWNENGEYVTKYGVYTLKKMLSEQECEAIEQKRKEETERVARQWEEWQEKHNKKEGESA